MYTAERYQELIEAEQRRIETIQRHLDSATKPEAIERLNRAQTRHGEAIARLKTTLDKVTGQESLDLREVAE